MPLRLILFEVFNSLCSIGSGAERDCGDLQHLHRSSGLSRSYSFREKTSRKMKGFLRDLLSKPFASLRQLENEIETVIKVLQPGPLGVIEHKFSDAEIRQANTNVAVAIQNWKRNAALEDRQILKHKDHGVGIDG